MINYFLQYLDQNMPNYLELSKNYLNGSLHSINIFFDSMVIMGQFTVWNDLKSTREFIDYNTENQILWHSSFNKNIEELIDEFNKFLDDIKNLNTHQT